jgi:antitoxin component YwqK of YwqJK toxin-antitoxin module
MKKFLILTLFVFSSALFAQDKINQFDEKGLRHGVWKGYHDESKRPRYEGTFEHGKEKGIFKYFDDTKASTVIATRDFSKGDGSCYTVFFDQKGNKVSEGLVVNKVYEGEWKYYHRESKDIMTIEFYKTGKLNGTRKVYYKNKTLAEEVVYKDGLKNGICKTYNENGKLIEDVNYFNDKLDGKAAYYDGTGAKLYEGNYKSGAKVGNWKFFENGKVIKEVKADKFSKELAKYEEKRMKSLTTSQKEGKK